MTTYERHRAAIELTGGGRAYNALIVASVRAVLADVTPRPCTTVELQDAHAPSDRQRVYNALRRLEKARTVAVYTGLDGAWWWLRTTYPACWRCGLPAVAVNRHPYGHWTDREFTRDGWRGGYVCRSPKCQRARVNLAGPDWPEWPWPDGPL